MPFVAFHHQLVGTTDHVNIIGLIELSDYIRSEQVPVSQNKIFFSSLGGQDNKENNYPAPRGLTPHP